MRTYVNTTLGQFELASLGRVDMHDHVILDRSNNPRIPEDFHHTDLDLIGSDLGKWREAGGGAVVDSSPIGAGRNIDLLEGVSQATGVPVIVSTGFHKLSYYGPDHWLFTASDDEVYDVLLGECTAGVLMDEEQPFTSERHHLSTHMIKVGVDSSGLTPAIRRILDAAGAVSKKLGVPCMLHTEPGVPFSDVITYLKGAEFNASKVMICHMGKSLDQGLFESLADKGFYLEFDEMVRPAPPLPVLVNSILALFEKGYGSSVLFAGDLARRSYWPCYGGEPSLAYLLTELNDTLKGLGLTEAMLSQIWQENPKGFFA